jgi:hypothetical protein
MNARTGNPLRFRIRAMGAPSGSSRRPRSPLDRSAPFAGDPPGPFRQPTFARSSDSIFDTRFPAGGMAHRHRRRDPARGRPNASGPPGTVQRRPGALKKDRLRGSEVPSFGRRFDIEGVCVIAAECAGGGALVVYPDTSFLVSLYGFDANNEEAARIAADLGEPLGVTLLQRHELRNAFRLAVFRKEITTEQCGAVLSLIDADLETGALASCGSKSPIVIRPRRL